MILMYVNYDFNIFLIHQSIYIFFSFFFFSMIMKLKIINEQMMMFKNKSVMFAIIIIDIKLHNFK
jgi:hypothetical protein